MEHDEKPSPIKSWITDLKSHLLIEPQSLEEILKILDQAAEKNILDFETRKMITGVLAVAKMQVRDIMIPRSQMAVLEQDQSIDEMLKIVSEVSHSRFPVIGENKDDVLGILLVKDFLKAYLMHGQEIDIQKILRPAYFVPESKRLDSLLNEFKTSHNHLAIVVDEYGGIAGLATIEDILEEIVGDIEDEFDEEEDESEIIKVDDNHYHLYALLELDEINEKLGTPFKDEAVDTIGGLLTRLLGHIPRMGESALYQDWELTALKADNRRILQVEIKKKQIPNEDAA